MTNKQFISGDNGMERSFSYLLNTIEPRFVLRGDLYASESWEKVFATSESVDFGKVERMMMQNLVQDFGRPSNNNEKLNGLVQ